MIYRPYDPKKDEKAAIRIWRECGWHDLKKSKKTLEAFRSFLGCGTADVAEYDGKAECLVTTHRGSIGLLKTELPFRAVTCVTVGRLLRRQGSAGKLTARAVMKAAVDGDAVAGLGVFDQGFYDKLGFGNFPYIHTVALDPLSLNVPRLKRPPVRLTVKDTPRITANIAERHFHHGLVKITLDGFWEMVVAESEEGFGLGFVDEEGRLSHHFWAKPKGESGPYDIWWMVYRDYEGLIELLSLLKNLGDQVNTFKLREPWGIQIQDLLKRPFRTREISEGGEHKNEMRAASWKQARILDMGKTLAALHLPAGQVRFNLELTDPIEAYLPDDAVWKGCGGNWTITLDEVGSTAEPGTVDGLPMMKASINAFTRLVFGVSTPGGLVVTDNLIAPATLLAELGEKLRLPAPDMVQIF